MGRIGLDTTILIDASKGHPKASEALARITEPVIAQLVVFEFLQGNLTPQQEKEFLSNVSRARTCDFTHEAAVIGAKVHRAAKRRGKTKPQADLAIAASYLAAGVTTIVTRNPQDYEGIENLRVETY